MCELLIHDVRNISCRFRSSETWKNCSDFRCILIRVVSDIFIVDKRYSDRIMSEQNLLYFGEQLPKLRLQSVTILDKLVSFRRHNLP